jgi:hypothetical protein
MFSKPEVTGGWVWEEIKGVKISCTTVQNMHAKCEDHPWHLHFLNKIMSSAKLFSVYLETTTMVLWWCLVISSRFLGKQKPSFWKPLALEYGACVMGPKACIMRTKASKHGKKCTHFGMFLLDEWFVM